MVTLLRAAALLLMVAAAVACDPGSKTYSQEFYSLHYSVGQNSSGSLVVSGTTDLPQGTEIDVVLTQSSEAGSAIDQGVLSGSTQSFGSLPVDKKGKFKVVATQVLLGTCHNQPPCGPFPPGSYHVLIDAKTPQDTGDPSVSTYGDTRFVSQTHGFVGFPGIEILKAVTLSRQIQLRIDQNGQQVNPGAAVNG